MKLAKQLTLALSVTLLSGCSVTAHMLGIPQSTWANYSDAQRQQMIANYKRIQDEQKQRAAKPKYNLYTEDIQYPSVNVSLSGGQVQMPPFTKPVSFKPVNFAIDRGSCKNVQLQQVDSNNHVNMRACYKQNVLSIDPSRYQLDKKDGSIRLYQSPLWQDSFTYQRISSSGYARLKDVNITISEENETASD